jgi:DNA polymerase-1
VKHFAVNTAHKWLNIPDDTLGIYNAHDCLATIRLHQALGLKMLETRQLVHYQDTYWPLVAPVMAMAKRGLLVDTFALGQTKVAVAKEIEATEAPIRTVAPGINLNSPQQRAALLYDTLALRCGKTTPTGNRSTDVYALDYILRNLRKKDEHALPILHAMFHRSRLNTIASRYLKLIPDHNNRIYPDIKLTVETLRFAYASPPIHQIPKEIRHIIRPERGNVFVSLDYSQVEARILAILSEDKPSLETFERGDDVHRRNAWDLFEYDNQQWIDLESLARTSTRNYAKSFLYGISYGGRSETLKSKLYCPCQECVSKVPPTLEVPPSRRAELEKAWFAKHPAVLDWRKALVAGVKRTKSYTTRFGYKRFFFAPAYSILPEIYNNPMQANAAGLMNQRFVRCSDAGLPPVIQMHDELTFQAPEGEATGVATQAKEIMEAKCRELDDNSFPVSVKIGDNWRDLEEVRL